MKICALFYLIGIAASYHSNTNAASTPAETAETYVVDLDKPPMERWKGFLNHFNSKEIVQTYRTFLKQVLPSEKLIPFVDAIGAKLDRFIPQPYADELRGVSKVLGMDLGAVVLANILYDITAFNTSKSLLACTSIVAIDKDNKIIHGRNLDYSNPDLLKPLTAQVEFYQKGKPLYMATTYAGYIGVITGSKHGAFSITGDERNKGLLWENLLSALEVSWPTFFLQRMVLEEATDYSSAIYYLTKIPTIAPVYYIVGGIHPGEGAIIVKNRWDVLDIKTMENSWYVLETNYDPWTAPPPDDDRRDAGIAAMKLVGKEKMSPSALYGVLSVPLVFNSRTTYTTIMSAGNSSVYYTMIRYDPPPKN